MSTIPAVAVVTRTRDRPVFLRRALRSVRRQRFRDWVHVIVNDGGDPGVVQSLLAECPAEQRARVLVLNHAAPRGMEAASNAGIAGSASRYIALLDDDDTWHPEFLQACVGFLDSPAGAKFGGVATRTVRVAEHVFGSTVVTLGRKSYNPSLTEVSFAGLLHRNQFTVHAFLYRRSAQQQVGGYPEEFRVLGDWDFNLRFAHQFPVAVVPLELANYHQRVFARRGAATNATGVVGRDQQAHFTAVIRERWQDVPEAKDISLPPSGMAAVPALEQGLVGKLGSGLSQVGRNLLHVLRHGPY
jgi:glycosyltransferase involved in cell wall biosynthesis